MRNRFLGCRSCIPIPLSSFRIESGGKSIVFATDGEYNNPSNQDLEPYIDFFRDADVLIFDAMYPTLQQTVEKENFGHSTAVIGVDLAMNASVRKLVLFHHDPESDDLQIAESYVNALEYMNEHKQEFPDASMAITTAYDGMVLDV